jgi:hypothetical protein
VQEIKSQMESEFLKFIKNFSNIGWITSFLILFLPDLNLIPENLSSNAPIVDMITIRLPHFADYISNMKIHQSAILI